MVKVTNTIIISKREYAELIGKAFAYDAFGRKVQAYIDEGREWALTDIEKAFFLEKKPKVDIGEELEKAFEEIGIDIHKPAEEDLDEVFFSDEEWQKIEELAEEEKE